MNKLQPIETAPKDGKPIRAEITGYGDDNVIAWFDGFTDSNDNDCGVWGYLKVTSNKESPPCWTDGYCWEVNEDGKQSAQPTRWMELHGENHDR